MQCLISRGKLLTILQSLPLLSQLLGQLVALPLLLLLFSHSQGLTTLAGKQGWIQMAALLW